MELMIIEDQNSEGSHLSSFLMKGGDRNSVDSGLTTAGGGHILKVRKPYTITKQRERWTEEEHEKFVEALKLYGRAWRKIEEHVGTKNAVQIRSHAQKFFCKVVRDSINNDSIEIPPPRPKKKPKHPYPRKLALSQKIHTPERSTSPNSSSIEQANQSPTSVLSPVISSSDASASADLSIVPDTSFSPVSRSPSEVEDDTSMQGENGSQTDEKLKLFPKVDSTLAKEEIANVACTKSLKLFGRTLVVVTSDNSPQSSCYSRLKSRHQAYGQQQLTNVNAQNTSTQDQAGCSFFMPLLDNHSEKREPVSASVGKPMDESPYIGKTLQKEESTSTGSVNAPGNWDMETQSRQSASLELPKCGQGQEKSALGSKPCLLGKRLRTDRYTSGFVPYKRSMSTSLRDTQSSSTTVTEKEVERMYPHL